MRPKLCQYHTWSGYRRGSWIRHSTNLLLTGWETITVHNDVFLLGGNRSYRAGSIALCGSRWARILSRNLLESIAALAQVQLDGVRVMGHRREEWHRFGQTEGYGPREDRQQLDAERWLTNQKRRSDRATYSRCPNRPSRRVLLPAFWLSLRHISTAATTESVTRPSPASSLQHASPRTLPPTRRDPFRVARYLPLQVGPVSHDPLSDGGYEAGAAERGPERVSCEPRAHDVALAPFGQGKRREHIETYSERDQAKQCFFRLGRGVWIVDGTDIDC